MHKVVVTDYPFEALDIEAGILQPLGCELVARKQALERADVAEGAPVGQGAARVDGGAGVEGVLLAVVSNARFRRPVGKGAVAVAPAPHHVKVLEREARRVDLGVAGGAGLQGAMLLELRADGRRAAGVRLDGRDAGWRWGRGLAEDAFHDPRAAYDRRGRGAVGSHLEDAGLGHQAAARAIRPRR